MADVWLKVRGLGPGCPPIRYPDWIEITQADHPDCKMRLSILGVYDGERWKLVEKPTDAPEPDNGQ